MVCRQLCRSGYRQYVLLYQNGQRKRRQADERKLFRCGQNIEYFEGVETWFERIDRFGAALDLEIEHYIISAGYEEIIAGCSIRKYFTDVFGCSYAYDEDGCPVWPARVVNYSTKTQYLSKINKGLGKLEDRAVNEFMPDDERPIPFTRMIYFGDGMTDIPSMRLVKERNGNAIAVYTPKSKNKNRRSNCFPTAGSISPCPPITAKTRILTRLLKPFWIKSQRNGTWMNSKPARKRRK